MEKIMNKENDWDQTTDADVVLGPIRRVIRVEIISAVKKMKLEKAAAPSEVNTEMIASSGKIGVKVMVKSCQRVVDGKRISDKWKTSVVVKIYKGKTDVSIMDHIEELSC